MTSFAFRFTCFAPISAVSISIVNSRLNFCSSSYMLNWWAYGDQTDWCCRFRVVLLLGVPSILDYTAYRWSSFRPHFGEWSAVGRGAGCRVHQTPTHGSDFRPDQASLPFVRGRWVGIRLVREGFNTDLPWNYNTGNRNSVYMPNTHSNVLHDLP